MNQLYLSVKDVALQTGFSEKTIRRRLDEFGFRKVNGRWRTHQMNVTAVMSGRSLRAEDARKENRGVLIS